MSLRFTDLIVWQRAMQLAREMYSVTALFPRDERFGIVAQLRRAAVSIPANIAEGHGRATRGEYLNQLSVARGSLMEVETLLILAEQLGFTDAAKLSSARGLSNDVGAMLVRLRSRLVSSGVGGPKGQRAERIPR